MQSPVHRLRPHHLLLLNNYILTGDNAEECLRNQINDHENFPQYGLQADLRYVNEGVPVEYSDDFVEDLIQYIHRLIKDPHAEIEVVEGPDSFCSLQCNRYGSEFCDNESEISKKDLKRHLGLEIGDVFTMSEIL